MRREPRVRRPAARRPPNPSRKEETCSPILAALVRASCAAFAVVVAPSGSRPPTAAASVRSKAKVRSRTADGSSRSLRPRPRSLFAIGAGEQVIAVDDQSNYPKRAPRTKLSGFTPNVEAIAEYEPDLVVIAYDPGGLAGFAAEGSHIPVLAAGCGPRPCPARTGRSASSARSPATASRPMRSSSSDEEPHREARRSRTEARCRLDLYHELDADLYSVTSKTFIGRVYALFGLRNIADAADKTGSGYPQLSAGVHRVLESPASSSSPTRVLRADPAHRRVPSGLGEDRGGAERRIVLRIDDSIASRWGPRIVEPRPRGRRGALARPALGARRGGGAPIRSRGDPGAALWGGRVGAVPRRRAARRRRSSALSTSGWADVIEVDRREGTRSSGVDVAALPGRRRDPLGASGSRESSSGCWSGRCSRRPGRRTRACSGTRSPTRTSSGWPRARASARRWRSRTSRAQSLIPPARVRRRGVAVAVTYALGRSAGRSARGRRSILAGVDDRLLLHGSADLRPAAARRHAAAGLQLDPRPAAETSGWSDVVLLLPYVAISFARDPARTGGMLDVLARRRRGGGEPRRQRAARAAAARGRGDARHGRGRLP